MKLTFKEFSQIFETNTRRIYRLEKSGAAKVESINGIKHIDVDINTITAAFNAKHFDKKSVEMLECQNSQNYIDIDVLEKKECQNNENDDVQKAYAESLHESYRKLLDAVGAPRANEWLENELQELENDMKILREERKKYMENIAGVLGVATP